MYGSVLGKFLGIIVGHDPGDFKSNKLHVTCFALFT